MSISGALNNALSGIYASARATEIVASNIANATTPGFGRRSLEVASSTSGTSGGVRVSGIVRHADQVLISDRQAAGADQAYHSLTNRFMDTYENLIGTPDEVNSLSNRLATFNADLITAISRPDATERLNAAVASADDLTAVLRRASEGVQDARSAADRTIAENVAQLNNALKQVQDVNTRIGRANSQGNASSALIDQRQLLIDEISELVPVRLIPRHGGTVALYSMGGAVLVDGRASEIGFTASNTVTPYMSVEGGALSGLTINDFPLRTSSVDGQLSGGALGAQFAIRDELGTQAQTQLDALARDLIARFEGVTEDATRGATTPGLFTDNDALLDPSDEIGLASRIEIFSGVNPAAGGQSWRLRDGLGATAQGPVGDASLLQAYADVLDARVIPASGNLSTAGVSAEGLIATLSSLVGGQRLYSDQSLSFASAQFAELRQMELADGVDTDAELQQLLVIEQSYAANARMIEVVDEMMQALLRI